MVSLDITLALPWSSWPWNEKDTMNTIRGWFSDNITSTNDDPIEAGKPHVIPVLANNVSMTKNGEKTLKPTTAHIEANALHGIRQKCALKRAHILLKCLMKKIDKFNREHNLFQIEFDEHDAHSKLLELLQRYVHNEDTDHLNQCMRYGYIFLSHTERKKHNELEKKNISINAAAAKQILFQRATQEDFKSGYVDDSRALTLMKDVVAEIANPGTLYINNHIHHSFPPICKFSIRETLFDKFEELASNFRCQYDVLSSSISTLVSIWYALKIKLLKVSLMLSLPQL